MTSRRRLLTIGHSYCVGVNRRLAQQLALEGWDVTAVAPARYRGDYRWHHVETSSTERYLLEAVPVRFGRVPHVMLYGGRLRELLLQRWDLIHCWEEPYVAAAAQLAWQALPHVPLVFATFQNILKRYPPPFNWIERYALGRADGIVAFGHTAVPTLVDRRFPESAIRVIPPGVDTALFAPDESSRSRVRTALGWDGNVPVIGFLGRFVPAKGIAMLTQVLDALAPPWRALIVGSGPLEGDLRAWAARYGGRVCIQTDVAHGDVAGWLNAMDVLVAPSQTTSQWREQFGRMLIEAAACGVPVVASDSGEIPYVVGDSGVILPERDAAAWVAALGDLLEDSGRRADLSRRGRRRAELHYDWQVVGRHHSAFFDDVIENRVRMRHRAA
jgi:glycosyltransferase involved in cell wall biosynthesis